MRYILDDNGYIESVSCTPFFCNNKGCTEYTRDTPEGYSSLEEWATTANVRAYKVVDGQLVYDSAKDTELQNLYSSQACTYSTIEQIIGTWIDGKPLYRKVIQYAGLGANTLLDIATIANADYIYIKNAYLRTTNSTKLVYPLNMVGYGGNLTDKAYVYSEKNVIKAYSSGSWSNTWQLVVIVEYTKTTD